MSAPRPADFELEESSGPVAPPYQYSLKMRVEARENGVTLQVGERRSDLPAERYEALWAVLNANGVMQRNTDLVGNKRGRIGVSINHVAIQAGGQTVRFDYLLTQLDDAENEPYRAIVDALKQLTGTT